DSAEGLFAQGNPKVVVTNTTFDGNDYGILAKFASTRVTAKNVSSSEEVGGAFAAVNGAHLNLESCVASSSITGLFVDGAGSIVRASNTMITQNTQGLSASNSGQ